MANRVSKEKKELARILYMSGEQQNIIAERIGVSKQSINRWIAEGAWDKLRAAKNITRPELINKVLRTIDKLLEKVLESEEDKDFDGLGDKLAKLAAVIEKFDKKANVVDAIEVFITFGKWLQHRATNDEELTPELIKAINRYQDFYVSELLSTKGQ